MTLICAYGTRATRKGCGGEELEAETRRIFGTAKTAAYFPIVITNEDFLCRRDSVPHLVLLKDTRY